MSGCISKGVKFELTEEQKELLAKIEIVKQEELVPYVANLLRGYNMEDEFDIPYSVDNVSISLSPVSCCLNHCSFCKSHYMNFELKSYPFEKVESLASDIEEIDYPFHHIAIHASNLSLYGVDLYGNRRSHEVIKTFTKPDKIKFAYVGALINWYPELIEEIIRNHKIKEIFVSLESGSERVYNLMNRPISLESLIKLIRFIRKERPDIIIHTELIAGFPTETIEDLKRTIDLIYELDIDPVFVHDYQNSEQIPSSMLLGHSYNYCMEAAYYAREKLLPLREKFKEKIWTGEMFVLEKNEEQKLYFAMLMNGILRNVRFDQLDRDYQEGEIIPANTVKPKQFVKRK
ncbi:MAG: radical SAM protein [Bacilli bacterium]|nr:radical SAM protein [Bacilli bacterium]